MMMRVLENFDANLKKTLVEWFWAALARVRLADLFGISKSEIKMGGENNYIKSR